MAYRCLNDPNWTMEFVSKGCRKLTGYSASALVGNAACSYASLIHPEDRDLVWERVQKAVARRKPFDSTYRIIAKTGREKWVSERGRGIFSPKGELIALDGFIYDITELMEARNRAQQLHKDLEESVRQRTAELRNANSQLKKEVTASHRKEEKLTEAKLRLEDRESRLKDFFDNANDLIQFVELDGTVSFTNRAWKKKLGYRSADLKTLKAVDLIEPQNREAFKEAVQKVESGRGVHDVELVFRSKSGSKCFLVMNADCRIENGRPGQMRCILQDRTKGKRAEEERKLFFDLSIDMMGVAGTDGYFKEVNPAFYRTLGWSKRKLLSTPFIDFVHPDDRELTAVEDRSSVGGKTTVSFENRYRCKDGSYKWISWNGIPLQEKGVSFAVGRDFTRQRENERQIVQTKLAAEQANRAKSEFLANMSHELRTPLNAIIGFSEVLLEKVFGVLNEKQEEYLRDIFSSGNHLLALINDILDLSKIEAGKLELSLEEFDLSQAVDEGLTMVKEKALSHGIRLGFDSKGAPKTIVADRTKFKQILFNLLSNAVKFTPDGGVVEVEALRKNGATIVLVKDTGIGIAEAVIEKIFRPFEQADGSINRRYGGTGLGLPLVRRLAELHGGRVWAESKPGQGSRFYFSIPHQCPIGAVTPVAWKEVGTKKPRIGEGMRALVVEDDSNAAKLISHHLGNMGLFVERAESAEKGLKALREFIPDLIVLDILLPGMSGWEFLNRLQELELCKSIPVIVASIVANENRGAALGAAAALQKPLNRNLLIETVERVLWKSGNGSNGAAVLAVDDNPKDLKLVETILTGEGIACSCAASGREALQYIERNRPDLIVLDLMMPEMSGFEVIERLKTRPETRAIPIVILSAKNIASEEWKELNEHVEKVFAKGAFDQREFANEVKKVLRLERKQKGFPQKNSVEKSIVENGR